jgi:protein-tyrosine-phosphatase
VLASDYVITMGCGDSCPIYPGKKYLDWQIADPAGKSLAEVEVIRDEIEKHVRELLLEIMC